MLQNSGASFGASILGGNSMLILRRLSDLLSLTELREGILAFKSQQNTFEFISHSVNLKRIIFVKKGIETKKS